MTNEPLKIYTDQGTAVNPSFKGLELTSYSCKPVRMGFPDFQAEVVCKDNLDNEWTGREYVTFRGERFYIRETPSAKYDNTSFLWKHSCTLVSESAEILGNVYFYDAVYSYASTKDKPCSNSTKVTFYGNIYEICDRINCSLKYRGIGDSILNTKMSLTTEDEPVGDGFCVMTDSYGDYDRETSWEFSFEDKNIWEVLTEVVSKTEIPFEKRGKKFIFGAVPKVVEHIFEQGFDKALLSVNHQNANAKVINNITMVGSSENIPHYYPNETEYGHISVDCTGNTHITADKVEIVNMNQFLSKISPDKKAELWFKPREASQLEVDSMEYAFKGSDWTFFDLGDSIVKEVNKDLFEDGQIRWYLRAKFNAPKDGEYIIDQITGFISGELFWTPEMIYVTLSHDMLSGVHFEALRANGVDDYSSQVGMRDGFLNLGNLKKGSYTIDFYFEIPFVFNTTLYCRLNDISIIGVGEAGSSDYGFQWKIGEKSYKTGQLGLKISEDFTEEMLGEKIGWTASGRMEFQSALMPPKYRQTLGTERFYKALNNTYTDPDTNDKYTFPNPFVEGAPVEHIYRNDKIKPTITGIENSTGALLGEVADVSYDLNDNDALRPEGESSGSEDDTSESLTYQHSFFYIRLNKFDGPFGFNLFKHASQNDPMIIQMTSGACAGCKFKVQAIEFEDSTGLKSYKNPVQTVDENGQIVIGDYERKVSRNNLQEWQQDTSTHSVWICLQKDTDTFGQILPSYTKGMTVKAHDTFNIINIDLPDPYILAAEKRLEDEGIRYMSDNNEEKFTFDIKASRIFFAENPDVLSTLDEYSVIKIKYEGVEYEQYVSGLTISVKAGEALPDIGITLTDTLSVGKGFEQRVAERAATLIANGYTAGGYIGGAGGGMSTSLADKRYINKQKNDRTKHKLSSDVGFEIGEFVSGNQGGIFYIDPDTGRSYIEVDEMRVRLKAMFEEIQVAKLDSIGGEMGVTPGGSVRITFVENRADCYRCFFKGKDLSEGAECRFHVGDQVQCKTDNISNGLTHNASNRYWWRLVTAVDNERCYFDLSKTDYDTASTDIPQGGDTAMQLGSRTDPKRRSAIIMSTINDNAPSVILYNGIDSYSLNNKAVVEYGVDKTKNPPEPFFHCYGSFYFGPRDRKTYLEYDAATGDLIFNGILNVGTKVGGQVLEDYIKSVSPPVEQEDIEDFVNNIVNPKLESLQNQIDGVVETWFYNGVPTLTNYPASEWATESLKIAHLGDLYYDNDTGTAYRFSQDEQGTYFWNTITDDAITKALAAAQKAQDTADGKRRVFTAQPTAQQVYDVGDLWVNATYGTQYSNDLLRCVTHKDAGAAFNIAHWALASKYTDDSALNAFIQRYETEINGYKQQLDGKIDTWYYAYDPTTENKPASDWTTPDDKAAHAGDLFYNTVTKKVFRWTGTAWESMTDPDIQNALDAASDAQDTADNKRRVFMGQPTVPYDKGDLWISTTPDGKTLKVCVTGRATGSFTAADWVIADDASLNAFSATIENSLNGIRDQLDQKAETWYQATDPSVAWETQIVKNEHKGDLWYCTADIAGTNFKKGTTWYWNGTAWEQQDIPQSVFDTIDGKAEIFVSKPTDGYKKNDLWFLEAPYTLKDNTEYAAGTLVVAVADMGLAWSAADWTKKDRYTDDTYARTVYDTYSYLKSALEQDTTVTKGLIMTSLVSLGYVDSDKKRHTMAGMNGMWIPNYGPRTIASWWGGEMIDRFGANGTLLNPVPDNAAAALVRMDGSAYWASGNIQFRANGTAQFGLDDSAITIGADGHLTIGNGISINIGGNAQVLGESIASVTELANKLSHLFTPYLGKSAKSWASIKTLSDYDSIKVNKSIWTDGFVSARGLNANGGSGGGSGSGKSYLSDLLDVDLGALSSGQVLTWNGTKWVNSALTLPDMAGYALESWVEANFQPKGDYLTTEAASTAFVSKAGDSMTGALNIGNSAPTQIWLNSSGTSETGIGFKVNGATLGWVGYNAYRGTVLYTYDGGHYLGIYSNGTPRFDGNVIWHAGNDGSGSGLDADLLDGKHRTEILRYEQDPTSETSLDNRVITGGIDMFNWDYAHAPNVAGQPSGDGAASAACVVSFGGRYSFQIYSDYLNTDLLYYRSFYSNTGWQAWRQFAFIDSNVASATKLKTARSIWGQSFDGSGNVRGNILNVENIIADYYYLANGSTNPYLRLTLNSKHWYVQAHNDKLFVGAGIASSMQIDSNGNVGIGLAHTTAPTAKLDVAGLVKASSGIQIGSTDGYGWYISQPNMICAGGGIARAVGAGSLLVSDAWADATKVPKNGIYSKGEIISSNIDAFRAISGDYGAIIRNDGEHLYFLLTNSKDQYGSYNGLRPLYINLATGLVKMQQGLQIGDCTISWDAANNMLKFDKGLYSEGPVSARGVNANGGTGGGSGSGKSYLSDLLDVDLGTLSSGQVLTWNGTKWVNSALTLPDMAGYALESWVEANFVTLDTAQTIKANKATSGNLHFVGAKQATGGKALGIYWDADSDPTATADSLGIGSLTDADSSGNVKDRYLYLGWGAIPWGLNTNLAVSTSRFTYKNYKVLHEGNYASVLDTRYLRLSGGMMANTNLVANLNADLLDGKHAGVKNGDAAIFVNFPSHSQLVSLGYNDAEHQIKTEYYFQGICKWAIDNYPNGGSLIGAVNPNSQGFVHLHLYNSKSANGYPTYCSGVWYNIEGHAYTFGTTNGTWYFGSGDWSINAASATKLKTARSIWGQSFNGSGNVSGNMSGVGSIAMNGGIDGANYIELKSATPFIDFHFNNDSGDYTSRIVELASGKLFINNAICANLNGNVGIGTSSPTAKLDVAGLVKASSGIQIGSTDGYGWYISQPNMICAGGGIARAVGAGSLLVSDAWADATKVPKNGIYSKGEIISSNIDAFRAISGDYGAIIRNDGEHLYFLLTNSKDQYGSYNGLRPLYINLATGLVKMQQGLQIGDCTISWDAANNMLKFDKGLYSEGGVSARGINTNAGGSGTSSGDYMKKDASNAGPYAMGNLIVNTGLSQFSMPADDELFICTDGQSGNTLAQKFPMTSLWKYIKAKADSNYATLDNVGLANLMWQVNEITDSIPSDDDMFAVADVGYDYDFCNKYHMSSLWQYIKSKMGLAFTVDGDNVAIGCQPGTLTLNGVTINAGSAVTCNSLTAQGVTAYSVTIGGPSADCVKIKYQGKTYTLQLAKLIQAGYLTQS